MNQLHTCILILLLLGSTCFAQGPVPADIATACASDVLFRNRIAPLRSFLTENCIPYSAIKPAKRCEIFVTIYSRFDERKRGKTILLAKELRPKQQFERASYDKDGRLLKWTSFINITPAFSYNYENIDQYTSIIRTEDQNGKQNGDAYEVSYDDNRNIIHIASKFQERELYTMELRYDASNRLIRTTDNTPNEFIYTYSDSTIICTGIPSGSNTVHDLDEKGRIIRIQELLEGKVADETVFTYNSQGQLEFERTRNLIEGYSNFWCYFIEEYEVVYRYQPSGQIEAAYVSFLDYTYQVEFVLD